MTRSVLSVVILLTCLASLTFGSVVPDRAADEKAIREHIDKIFQAYIYKDRDGVKATHSVNWRGFLSGSRTIIRGIDGYMSVVDGQGALDKQKTFQLVNYKFLDFDLVFYGKTGVVTYIAEMFWQDGKAKGSYKLRSIDIYAKENGKWNQVASNIGPLPDGQASVNSPLPVSPSHTAKLENSGN